MSRIFLLSPAYSGGKRAAMLTRAGASFELACQVQIGSATLGDDFTFCSGLYFRGKLTYARRFATPPSGVPGVMVITPSRGLLSPETMVGPTDLAEFAAITVDSREPRFTQPLQLTCKQLMDIGNIEFVLLGSVATGKYLDTLGPIFGSRLFFPQDFAGRGDMSRGALLLRATVEGKELLYAPVDLLPIRVRRRSAKS
jgi:hypothetical protein